MKNTSLMANFLNKHSDFLKDVYNSSKLNTNPMTMIPSIVFLSTAFAGLYTHIQDFQVYAGWKGIFCRELVFHWAFFYISRLWFIFVKFAKHVMMALEVYIIGVSPPEEIYMNILVVQVCVFMLVLTISILPLTIISLHHMFSPSFHNLVVWVEEDPWVRSEIGISGHYLRRPVEAVRNPKSHKTSYRSKRSTSVGNELVASRKYAFRPCKSMMTLKSFNA